MQKVKHTKQKGAGRKSKGRDIIFFRSFKQAIWFLISNIYTEAVQKAQPPARSLEERWDEISPQLSIVMQEGTIPQVVPFDAASAVPIDDQKYVYVVLLLDFSDIGKLNFRSQKDIFDCGLVDSQGRCDEEGPKAITVEGSRASYRTHSCSKVSVLFLL